ncbi:helix-turn-helix domain-containing protein [Salipiger thiooxidans]|uniref:helix-turn-helix domain-containing protein n=1 Tax=Salipiger thiooxidans TaxID=282683 RepID=UPI001CD4C6A4|nr:helix-turn-helix domain-containing protein [Salipiger thiooxidans]MCA0849801.1 helix-turn-helix domain-containing protein [Salipiger thiooxidans]
MLGYDEWRTRLRSCCGHFDSEPTSDRAASDRFERQQVHGFDMASVRCRINRIDRTSEGIRRDDAEYFFLWYQIDGVTGISHSDRDTLLTPGDFILLDSTREAQFVFNGKQSEFYSVHLPRSLFMADRQLAPATGWKVTQRHPLQASLVNLVAHTNVEATDLDGFRSDCFFDFVAMVFGPDPAHSTIRQFRHRVDRLRYITQVIDQNLRHHGFSVDELAVKVGRSKRQLQRDLASAQTSFTELLQDRRLKYFVSAGQRYGRSGARINIAELAQSSGFSDQSHFNHLFRERYDTTPGDFLKRVIRDDPSQLAP